MSHPGNTSSNPHNRRSQGRQSSYQGGPQENTGFATGSDRPAPHHSNTAPPGTSPGAQRPNAQRLESDNGKHQWLKWSAVYILTQVMGGFFGAWIVRGIYDNELTAAGKLKKTELGATTPGGRLPMLVPIGGDGADVAVEILGCAIVAYFNFILIDKNHTVVTRHVRPLITGAAYALSILAAGSRPLSLNLARDLSPRLLGTSQGDKKGDAWKGQPYIASTMGMSLLVTPITRWLYDIIMHGYKKSVQAVEAEIMPLEQEREGWNGPFRRARAGYRKVIMSCKDDPEFRKTWAIPESWL